jgi:hypothetical protein
VRKRSLLDKDLADLYQVTTGNLNKAVRRNQDRFPEDFMFQLTAEELESLIFQSGISNDRQFVAEVDFAPMPSPNRG